MSIRQNYRGNPSEKKYEMIVDFSKGINTKDADALLTDNTAREVLNFDIIAGGMLSKRPGYSGMKSDIKATLAALMKKTLGLTEDYDMTKLEIVKSETFNDGEKSIISAITKDNVVLNYILNNGELTSITAIKMSSTTMMIENNGFNNILFTDKVESGKTIREMYAWENNNWRYLDPKVITDINTGDIHVEGSDYTNYITESDVTLSGVKGRNDLLVDEYSLEYNIKTMFKENDLYNYTYTWTDTTSFDFEPWAKMAFGNSHETWYYQSWPTNLVINKDNVDAIAAKLSTDKNGLLKILTSDETAVKKLKVRCWKEDSLFTRVYIEATLNINGIDVLTNYDSYKGQIGELVKGLLLPANYENDLTSGTNGDNSKYTDWPYFKIDSQSSFDILKQIKLGKSALLIKKYIPNPFEMQRYSYNLLTLANGDDIYNFNTVDTTKINVDKESSFPEIDGIVQLNGYFAQVGITTKYKISLALPASATRTNWKFGYHFKPLEEWNKLIQSAETDAEYVTNVIKPAFENNKNNSSYGSVIDIQPKTSGQYILMVFATDKDPTTATKTSEFIQLNKNIIPVSTNGILQTPRNVVDNFYKAKKSMMWKNQLFMYGGSSSFFVSNVNDVSYIPMLNNFQIPTNEEIISIHPFYDTLIIATKRNQFVLTGDSPSTFKINDLNNDLGVLAYKTVKNNSNFLFQMTEDGMYKVKTLFNFHNRYNVEKIDNAISGNIKVDENAIAVVHRNKYFLCTPSDKKIWIFYNEYNSWIRYESALFNLDNMFVIDNELILVNKGGNILRQNFTDSFEYKTIDVNGAEDSAGNVLIHQEEIKTDINDKYFDVDMDGTKLKVISKYKSKQVDFGLPNHDKKLKKLQVRFEDTPGVNPVFINAWVDSYQTVSDEDKVVGYTSAGQVEYTNTREPQIKTIPQSEFNKHGTDFGLGKGDSEFISDTDQLHEIVVSGKGRQLQFEITHEQASEVNIKNFGIILKVKKPKARRTASVSGISKTRR